ncbi:MAG: hypothetical protein J7M34_00795 [Anaerolineae bacterium]|nr:hypothetical protein [Anaerolineae bacterium]
MSSRGVHPADSSSWHLRKGNLIWMEMLVFGGLLSLALLLTGTGCLHSCSSSSSSSSSSMLTRYASYRAAVNAAAPRYMEVWVDIGITGVYSPALTLPGSADGVMGVPAYLDELAEKGYLAIRVPHAPPTYTPSGLVPGIPPWAPDAVLFTYYSPPNAPTATTVPVTVTRVMTYESIVNERYPIDDGRSHWEVWWIEGNRFPIPDDTFQLKDEWPKAIEVAFRIDFGAGANALDCAGCPVEVLLYNGYTFIGPFQIPLVIETEPPPPGNPLVVFDQGCTGMTAESLQYITPTVPFSHTHWLANFDTETRTFTITASSSQGWDYTYYYGLAGQPLQLAPGLPFTVTVEPGQPGGWPPAPCVNITAVYTPTITISDTLRETLRLTATSVISPDVWADTVSFALAPGYQLNEGGGRSGLYLPLVIKGSS